MLPEIDGISREKLDSLLLQLAHELKKVKGQIFIVNLSWLAVVQLLLIISSVRTH